MQPAPPVVSTKITATQELVGMPWRAKWGVWSHAVHLWRATALECDCCGWTQRDPPLIELDLSSAQPNSVTITIQVPTTTPVLPPSLASPANLTPVFTQYAKERATISGLGGSDTKWSNRGSPRLNEEDPAIPALMASPIQVSSWVVNPEDVPSITHVSHSPSPPTMPQIPKVASTFHIPQLQTPPRADLAWLPDEVLWLQGQIKAAIEWLFMTRATMDSHCWELELNTKLAVCMNEAKATKAIKEAEVSHAAEIKEAELHCIIRIKEAEVHCTTNSCVLQQTQRESMLALEHEVIAEEGWDCHTFVEASIAALWACLPKTCGAMMYPYNF